MKELLLAIDVGNTDTVFGIFRREALLSEWRAPSARMKHRARAWQTIRLLLAEAGAAHKDLRGVAISSVIPAHARALSLLLRKQTHLAPYVISGSDPAGFRVAYAAPGTLGPDRLCSAAAARHKFGAPLIIVDIGTAVTYDVILRSGAYAGGAIAAGIAATTASLARSTARLPEIPLEFPARVIGTDTVACLQSGLLYGALDAMEGMIRRIRKITGPGTTVVATGGYAPLFARHSRLIRYVEPSLVLDGARLLFERRSSRRTKR